MRIMFIFLTALIVMTVCFSSIAAERILPEEVRNVAREAASYLKKTNEQDVKNCLALSYTTKVTAEQLHPELGIEQFLTQLEFWYTAFQGQDGRDVTANDWVKGYEVSAAFGNPLIFPAPDDSKVEFCSARMMRAIKAMRKNKASK